MGQIQVFLDSDVIISSLLSKTGASSELIYNTKTIKIISNVVKEEVIEVTKRLKITNKKQIERLFKRTRIIKIGLSKEKLLNKYSKYVFDKEDSHIVAGVHESD